MEAVSAHLIVRIDESDAAEEWSALERRLPSQSVLRLVTPESTAPSVAVPTHRLSAVRRPAPEENPALSSLQRERMLLLDTLEAPHNLPGAEFAKLAGKSRRWISDEIQSGNLLAIAVDNRGQRMPDWNLDPVKHRLIQAVHKHPWDADAWQIYSTLSRPNAMLDGYVLVKMVTQENLPEVVRAAHFSLKATDKGFRRTA